MPRHHLVAAHAFEHRVHDRPLRCGFAPAPVGFFLGQTHHPPGAEVAMQLPVHDKYPAPHDVARLGDPFHRAAAQAEVYRGLPFTGGAAVSANKMSRRRGAGNEEHPHIFVQFVPQAALAFSGRQARIEPRPDVPFAPTQIVQRVLRRKSQLAPEPVRHQAIQTGAFVDFIEMRQRFALKQHPPRPRMAHRRPIHVVQ